MTSHYLGSGMIFLRVELAPPLAKHSRWTRTRRRSLALHTRRPLKRRFDLDRFFNAPNFTVAPS